MLIIRGINIFPSQIEAILVDIEGLQPNYQIIVDKVGALDSLDLQVEVSDKICSDSGGVKELQKIEKRIVKDMKDYLGICRARQACPAQYSAKNRGEKLLINATFDQHIRGLR